MSIFQNVLPQTAAYSVSITCGELLFLTICNTSCEEINSLYSRKSYIIILRHFTD